MLGSTVVGGMGAASDESYGKPTQQHYQPTQTTSSSSSPPIGLPTKNHNISSNNDTYSNTNKNNTNNNSNDDLKLQMATQCCSRGRQKWTEGKYDSALHEFRQALLILEALLGGGHPLVAQLYHWMGLIFQEQLDYDRAVQSLVRCLRMRWSNSRGGTDASSGKSTPQNGTAMEVQVALSNLWQAQGETSATTFERIRNLQESVQLEQEGDAALDDNGNNNFLLAMKLYQKSMHVFPDPHNCGVMGKLALCYHHQARGTAGNDGNSSSQAYLDQAVVWYRMSLKVFCASVRFPPPGCSNTADGSVSRDAIVSHSDCQWIVQRLQLVLKDYYTIDVTTIQQYAKSVLESVVHLQLAEDLTRQYFQEQLKQNSDYTATDCLSTARLEYRAALGLEEPVLGRYHLVVNNLHKEIATIDQLYIVQLEAQHAAAQERLRLLEGQSSDWIQTVRYQEEQLTTIQGSVKQRDTQMTEALQAIARKEAETVGWKRKFDAAQAEWKTAEKKLQNLQDQNNLLQQQAAARDAKVSQLEYSLKRQDIDHASSQDAIRAKRTEAQEWKEKYESILQANQQLLTQAQRSTAVERELQNRLVELQHQNSVLKDLNREIQTQHHEQSRSIASEKDQRIQELESGLKDAVAEKERLIRRHQQTQKELRKRQNNENVSKSTMNSPKEKGPNSEKAGLENNHQDATEVVAALEDKLLHLEKHVTKLEKDKADLKTSLKGLQGKKSSKRSTQKAEIVQNDRITSEKSLMQDDEERAASLTEILFDLSRKEHEETKERAAVLATQLANTEMSLELSRQENEEAVSKLQKLEKSKGGLEKGIADAQKIIAMLKTANSDRIEKCSQLQEELERYVKDSKRLKTCGENEDDEGGMEASAQDILIDQVAELEIQNEDMRDQLQKSMGDNTRLTEAIKSLQEQVEDLEQQKEENVARRQAEGGEETKASLALASTETEEGSVIRVVELEKELQEAVTENQDLRSEVLKWRKELELSRVQGPTDRQQLSDRCFELEVSLHEVVTEKNMLKGEIKKLKELPERQGGGNDQKRLLTARCTELELELNEAMEKIEDLSAEIGKCRKHVESSNNERQRLAEHCAKLERELERTAGGGHTLSAQVRARNEQLDSMLSENRRSSSDLEVATDASRRLNDQLPLEANEYQARSESAERQVTDDKGLQNKCETMEKEIQNLEKQIQALASQNEDLKSQLELSKGEKREEERLLNRCSELEKELQDSLKQKDALASENTFYKNQLDAAEEEQQEYKAHIEQFQETENRLQDAVKQKRDLANENAAYRDQLDSTDEEHQQYKALVDRFDGLEKELQDTKEQNQILMMQAEQQSKARADTSGRDRKEQQRLADRCAQVENELQMAGEEKERLSAEVVTLTSQVRDTKEQIKVIMMQAEQQSKSRAMPLSSKEKKEHQRVTSRCSELEKQLEASTEQNVKLTSQVAALKENLDTMGNDRIEKHDLLERCAGLEAELRITDERYEKLLAASEEDLKDQEELIRRVRALQNELRESAEHNEQLSSQLKAYKLHVEASMSGVADGPRLIDRCTELDVERSLAEERSKRLAAQVESYTRQMEDLEAYADETANELEKAGRIIAQLRALGAEDSSPPCTSQDLEEPKPRHEDSQDGLENQVRHGHSQDDVTVEKLRAAKDELQRLLDEALKESLVQIEEQDRLAEQADKAEKDRNEIDGLYRQCRGEVAELKGELITAREHLRDAQAENEELSRRLEIERHVAESRRAAAGGDPDEESELEDLYRQAREELKEVEAMLFEAEDQLAVLKSKNAKLEEEGGGAVRPRNDDHGGPDEDPLSDTVHSLDGLSREELIHENRRTIRKLAESRTRVVDLQENAIILQTQLKDALNFKQQQSSRQQKKKFWGRS